MNRADRRTQNDDNARNHPVARQVEPMTSKEQQQSLATIRAQRNEAQDALKQSQVAMEGLQLAVQDWTDRAQQNHQLFVDEQQRYQHTLVLYDQEKNRANQLLIQYETADAERAKYLALYTETDAALKFERRSKAGIKGWETRRKKENERLKQEIGDMALLLQESLARKDEAVDSLYAVAERMDRIQKLVNSVEDGGEANNPVGLMQKFQRIWLTIREILAE
jgi:ATP-dependent Lon protease